MHKTTGIRPLFYIALLVCLLFGTSQAAIVTAEPDEWLLEETDAGIVSLEPEGWLQEETDLDIIPTEPERWLLEETDEDLRAVQPRPGIAELPIGANSTNPAIAHGGEHYLVVYTHQRKVMARSVHNNGTLGTAFEIDSHGTIPFGAPSVSYNPLSGLFLVAYHLCNLATPQVCEVRATAVSHSGVVGTGLIYYYSDARFPSVACSHQYNSCLLAFESEFGTFQYIRGRYLTINSTSGIQTQSEMKNLSNLSGKRPYVAVGKGFGYYMITYTRTLIGVEYPMYNHLYESPPSPGFLNAYVYDAAYVLDFSASPYWANKNKWATGITYDPCTEHFIILFDFDYSGNRTIVDIYMAAIHKLTRTTNWSGVIAIRNFREESGGVSFVTNYIQAPACGMMDKLVITYTNFHENKHYAVQVRGDNDKSNPSYSSDAFDKHHSLMLPSNGLVYGTPNIAGGSVNAELLIVYDLKFTDPLTYHVYGRLVHVREPFSGKLYLPLIVR